ncbi:MAG: permease, partial [Desulfobacterales bacterium]
MELKPIAEFTSCCSTSKVSPPKQAEERPARIKPAEVAIFVAALTGWWLVYQNLLPMARYLTYDLFGLSEGSHFAAALEFFIYDTPKVLMLLAIVVFGVGIVNTFFTPERTRRILAGKKEAVGNVLAALLGVATPFCSCSAIPLFIGFVTAGIPLGVTFSFLIAAPMINEVAVVLLYGLLGWKIAAIYAGTGLLIAMVAGWLIGRLKMEKYIEEWVTQVRTNDAEIVSGPQNLRDRVSAG